MQYKKHIIILVFAMAITGVCFCQTNPTDSVKRSGDLLSNRKLLQVVLPDIDHDGVTDQFDNQPNTPAGCIVDTHGVSVDTDGDGVPDCKDKERLTSRKCFPVDSTGLGICPPKTP